MYTLSDSGLMLRNNFKHQRNVHKFVFKERVLDRVDHDVCETQRLRPNHERIRHNESNNIEERRDSGTYTIAELTTKPRPVIPLNSIVR